MIEEITPPHLRCIVGQCVSVHRMEDGQLLIIGKEPGAEVAAEIAHKVGPDERAVIISPEYLRDVIARTA